MPFVSCTTHVASEKALPFGLCVLNETTMAALRGTGADQLETVTRDILRDAVYSACDADD
jgi:antitoxin component of RelBE/YafQ-DinJ toxin-antitoxin module